MAGLGLISIQNAPRDSTKRSVELFRTGGLRAAYVASVEYGGGPHSLEATW